MNSAEAEISSSAEDPLYLHWAGLSLSGTKKEINDDAVLLFSASPAQGMKTLPLFGKSGILQDDLFFGVSDGMGGGNAGNIASKLLLDELSRVIPNTFHVAASGMRPDYLEYLDETIKYIHAGINECASVHQEWAGMSATLTLAWFTPDNMYFVHVGDSRLYLHRDGKTTQLSRDHTFVWKQWQRHEINEFQYRKHPRRSALYEVIGGGHEWVMPFVSSHGFQKGDRFLLCTDGLVDGLWERHIHEYLDDRCKAPEETSRLLGEHAMASDSADDKTLIVIDIL